MPASRQRSRSRSQPSGDAEVDRDDAVLGLAALAAPLPLHAGGLGPLLGGGGLIDDADGAQLVAGDSAEGGGDVLLEGVAGDAVGPGVVLEEFLEGADGGAGGQGDGLAGLAGQVGEQAAAVDAQEVEGLGVVAAEEELLEVVGEGRAHLLELFRRHGNLRLGPGGSVRILRHAAT